MSENGGSRRGRRRGSGLVSALAGAGLLVVVGFALGVVAGLVMEEPELLLDYVTGRTTPIAVAGGIEGAGTPDVAARPPDPAPLEALTAPEPSRPAPEAPSSAAPMQGSEERPPSPAPAAEEARVASAAPSDLPARGFAVQVGAFADSAAAEQLTHRLREKGHRVYVAPSAGADARWRVRVGPLRTRGEADALARRLEREERLGTWVLAESQR